MVIPMLSETSGCYVYCFFVQYLMLYFAGANIIIKGEKTVCRLFLSMFYGIIIRMQSEKGGKHNTPHLHAVYNEHEIVMDFTGKILEGSFPSKQLKLLTAWTALHEDELNANWILLSAGDGYFKIEPLR